jgi:ankyrin repeat protein
VGEDVHDKYDTVLLHSAAYHGRLEMVRMLLDHSVKSNSKNHRGETALHVVSRGRHDSQDGVRVARLLLDRGVDVNLQNEDRNFPLHFASYSGKLEIVRVLLNSGANANAKNDRGEAPLHQVSQGEYESQADGVCIAQLLLDRDVDVNTQDKNGVTSLHLASWCGKFEIARLLLEHATLKNNKVRTLLHIGVEGKYFLQEHNYFIHCIAHTSFRARHRLERTTKRPRNTTTLRMLPGEARDRAATS